MTEDNTKKVLTGCALCYHSCGVEVSVRNGKVVEVRGQESHPLNKGSLCPKGEAMIEHLYHPDRLKYPLKKVNGDVGEDLMGSSHFGNRSKTE